MIDGLKPYSAYKDSGMPWLEKVPVHWEIRRLGSSVEGCINGIWGSEPNGRDDLPCVRVADFDRTRLRVRLSAPTLRAIAECERTRRLLKKGDLLLEKSGGGDLQPVGVVMLYDHSTVAVSSNFVARMPVASGHNPAYLAYLHFYLYSIRLNVRSIKQTTGIQNLDSSSYLSESVAFPPLIEQSLIVRFLDHADQLIRRYIRAKKRLIVLLNEQKQAIIHKAVTRGLDANVKLKPSGIDWLGDVPDHWEIRRLRTLVHHIDQGVSPQAEAQLSDEKTWGVLKAGCVNHGIFRPTEHKRLPVNFEIDQNIVIKTGDVLVSRACGSPHLVGSVARVTPNNYNLILSDKTFRLIFKEPDLVDFLVTAMNAPYYRRQVRLAISGAEGLANNLPLSSLRDFLFFVPPPNEALRIHEALSKDLNQIQRTLEKAEREIVLLQEFRTRLIADVVTGKLDVRDAAAQIPEEIAELEPLGEPDEAIENEDLLDDSDLEEAAMEAGA